MLDNISADEQLKSSRPDHLTHARLFGAYEGTRGRKVYIIDASDKKDQNTDVQEYPHNPDHAIAAVSLVTMHFRE